MSKIIFFFSLLLLLSCNSKPSVESNKQSELFNRDTFGYKITELPIRLESLTEAERQLIRELNEKDTSSYLIQTRPVLFQIQGTGNDQDQTRYTLPIHKDVELLIYSLGEVRDSNWLDHGWIENANTGKVVWKMNYHKSTYAGGDFRNRKVVERITLPAGRYRLRYQTNNSHAFENWVAEKPENDFYYGITAFNLKAIELIQSKIPN